MPRRLLVLGALAVGLSASPAAAQQPPVLTAFAIDSGAERASSTDETVVLSHRVVGARPSEYRVSARADFAGAQWVPYADVPTLRGWYRPDGESCDPTRRSHRVTLFFQVRATMGEEVRIVAGQRTLVPSRVESNVLRDTICAVDAATGLDGSSSDRHINPVR